MGEYTFVADKPVSQYHKSDFSLLASIIIMLGIGLFTLYFSTQVYAERFLGNSFDIVKRQVICSLVGFGGFFFFWFAKMKMIRKILPFFVIGILVMCLLTFIPGISIEKNGARRWLKLPFNFSLQSSEFVKFAVVLFLANLFDRQVKISNVEERNVFPCVIGMVFFVALVFLQKDFSTSAFIFIVSFIMFMASGMKIKWIFPLLFLIIPVIIFSIMMESYRIDRIYGLLHPEEGALDINFQSNRAKMAISAGSFWGSGIGTGIVQSVKIPEVQADYIFASWAEAMGFLGVLIYFLILGFFAWKGYKAAFNNTDAFASYCCFGCVTMIVLQALFNCGVVCGVFPSTGIPLPFFSSGGSSIIVTLCMCGFIMNASRNNNDEAATYSEEKYVQVNRFGFDTDEDMTDE